MPGAGSFGIVSMRRVSGSLFAGFAARAGLTGNASLGDVVAAIHAIPYGRPASRTPDGVLREWKGTCSTKHALLAQIVAERWPQLRPGSFTGCTGSIAQTR